MKGKPIPPGGTLRLRKMDIADYYIKFMLRLRHSTI
jgi:hypothetical protein